MRIKVRKNAPTVSSASFRLIYLQYFIIIHVYYCILLRPSGKIKTKIRQIVTEELSCCLVQFFLFSVAGAGFSGFYNDNNNNNNNNEAFE